MCLRRVNFSCKIRWNQRTVSKTFILCQLLVLFLTNVIKVSSSPNGRTNTMRRSDTSSSSSSSTVMAGKMEKFWKNLDRSIDSIEKYEEGLLKQERNRNDLTQDYPDSMNSDSDLDKDLIGEVHNTTGSLPVVDGLTNTTNALPTNGITNGTLSTLPLDDGKGEDITTPMSSIMTTPTPMSTITTRIPVISSNQPSTTTPHIAPTTASSSTSSSSSGGKDVVGCQCGLKKGGTGKIVGGNLAEDKAWPWMAALVFVGDAKPRQFCGASLINNQYVMTAAHCVQDMASVGLENFRIYLGTNLIDGNSTTRVRISEIKSHPAFNKRTLNSDIALIKLAAPFTAYTDSITPVCLGQTGAPHIGKLSTVSGWGSLSSASLPVNALRNVNVQVISNPDCDADYSKVKIRITDKMLCAALPKKDSCKGDSGGPLFSRRTKTSALFDQLGIVSFGQDCAKPGFPGVYTRVGRFIPWIRENTKDASYCTLSFSKA